MQEFKAYHRGRIRQIQIYLGKFFRMFIFLNDWKVLPMAALIAGLVSFVVGGSMFVTMEGSLMGSLALACICLWNGCFNSIQVVCRERGIVKREHRSGMHVFSYITAHMIYQAFLCAMQSVITILVLQLTRVALPSEGFITPWFVLDFGITLFLITYAADMMSLMISCIVRTTTAAMTVMPLVLIFQLVFSGVMFSLSGSAAKLTSLTISRWGIRCLCAQMNYNSLPMVALWNQIFKFRSYEFEGVRPVEAFTNYIQEHDLIDKFCAEAGAASTNPVYELSYENVFSCWLHLLGFVVLFAFLAMLFLKRIDNDKR